MIKQRHIYRITAAALTAALLFLPGCGTLGSGSAVSSAPAQVEVEKEYARFPRFQDRKVNQNNRVLTLTNWKKSPFRLGYTLSVNGQTIYESPVLEPGEKLEWDILAYCKESCDLDITATAFSKEGKEQKQRDPDHPLDLAQGEKNKEKNTRKRKPADRPGDGRSSSDREEGYTVKKNYSAAFAGVTVYRHLLKLPPLAALTRLFRALEQQDGENALEGYTETFYTLTQEGTDSLSDYLVDQLRYGISSYAQAAPMDKLAWCSPRRQNGIWRSLRVWPRWNRLRSKQNWPLWCRRIGRTPCRPCQSGDTDRCRNLVR